MDTARWRLRAALMAAALLAASVPLSGCAAKDSASVTAQNASNGDEENRHYDDSLISGIDDNSLPAGVRVTILRYPPTNCPESFVRTSKKLPPPWEIRACAPDKTVITGKLTRLGFSEGAGRDLLQHYVLIEIEHDPRAAAHSYFRRVKMFDAELGPGPSEQAYIAKLLGRKELGPFVAAGNPQPQLPSRLFGRAYLFDEARKIVCEVNGPRQDIFACGILQPRRSLEVTFLRARVGPDFPALFNRILSEIPLDQGA